MRTIRLYGELGEKFGTEYTWDVKNVKEAISLLCANFKEFKQHLIDSDTRLAGYEVWSGDFNLSGDSAEEFCINGSGDIRIVPVIKGASAVARIIVGVVILAFAWWNPLGWAAGSALMGATVGIGASLVVGGVIELLSPKPKLSGITSQDSNESYLFNGTYNSTKQGTPIGLGYGEMIVGSSVVSQSITISEIPVE